MKPGKSFDDILIALRAMQEKAYLAKDSMSVDDIERVALELSAINFSISYYAVFYEDLSNKLEAMYKNEVAKTFMEEKANKSTDGKAENTARITHYDTKVQYTDAYRDFKSAQSYHGDVNTLIGVLRSRASTLKKS
jgi:hypothetical protein